MITRRKFVKNCLWVFVGSVVCTPWTYGKESSRDNDAILFRWRVPEAHKAMVDKTLRFQGQAEPEKDQKGVLVWIFVGLVLLPDLAKAIYELIQGMEKGGVKIDTRGGKFDIDTDKSLPPGMSRARRA